jgi:glycosyltransferase involved in cell wall biosynthesis
MTAPRRVLFVSHNAARGGAPRLLLRFLQWVRRHTTTDVATVLLEGGPLADAFAELGQVVPLADARAVAGGVDLLYLNSVGSAPALTAVGGTDAPVLCHVHEEGYALDHWVDPADRARLLERTGHYIAVSHTVERGLVERGVDPDRITQLHGFIDVAEVSAGARRARHRSDLGLADDVAVVGASGTTEWRKAPDLFVQLGGRVRSRATGPAALVWVGGSRGGPDIDPQLVDRDRAGLGEALHFVGEQTDPYAWYPLFDVFVLTSRLDPFPLTMLEVSALGIPIVAFDGTGATELLADGAGVVVPFADVDAMAVAVLSLLGDPDRRRDLGAVAAARVRDHHDVEAAAPRLFEQVCRVASSPS